jgi:hypothetical protein
LVNGNGKLHAARSNLAVLVESGEVDFSRTLTYPSAGSTNKYLWIAGHKRTKP